MDISGNLMEPDLLINHHQQNVDSVVRKFSENLIQIPQSDLIRELQTVIRDKTTTRNDFTFYADRLIRLVVEEGLNQLPYSDKNVTTPSGRTYQGLQFMRGTCGVSVMRSGEAMERGLRDCARSIRIGKILIQTDQETDEAQVFYAKFPPEIESRNVLLMYPIMSSGNTIMKAVEVLKNNGVQVNRVILLNLFSTPKSLDMILTNYPELTILTSEIHPIVPNHFGQKYFGTE